MTESGSGTKHDQEKAPLELLSSIWVEGVGRVLGFGKKKYAAHNWRKGIQLSRLLGAALRHIFAYLRGEDNDLESGLPHLDHASCCLMFARELSETRPDLDDRWTSEKTIEKMKKDFNASMELNMTKVRGGELMGYQTHKNIGTEPDVAAESPCAESAKQTLVEQVFASPIHSVDMRDRLMRAWDRTGLHPSENDSTFAIFWENVKEDLPRW